MKNPVKIDIKQLEYALNCLGIDNICGTPDFELAEKIFKQAEMKHHLRLYEAANKLYRAGRWDCATLSIEEQADLWSELSLALGLEPGTATMLGVGASMPEEHVKVSPEVEAKIDAAVRAGRIFDGRTEDVLVKAIEEYLEAERDEDMMVSSHMPRKPSREYKQNLFRASQNLHIALSLRKSAIESDSDQRAYERELLGVISVMYDAMDMQQKRSSGEFHIPTPTAMQIWDAAKENARRVLDKARGDIQ